MAVTPDGTQIVTGGGEDGRVLVWDRASATQIAELTGHNSGVTAVAVTLDGAQIICGSSYPDGRVLVWDRSTGIQIAELSGHTGGIYALAVTPTAPTSLRAVKARGVAAMVVRECGTAPPERRAPS